MLGASVAVDACPSGTSSARTGLRARGRRARGGRADEQLLRGCAQAAPSQLRLCCTSRDVMPVEARFECCVTALCLRARSADWPPGTRPGGEERLASARRYATDHAGPARPHSLKATHEDPQAAGAAQPVPSVAGARSSGPRGTRLASSKAGMQVDHRGASVARWRASRRRVRRRVASRKLNERQPRRSGGGRWLPPRSLILCNSCCQGRRGVRHAFLQRSRGHGQRLCSVVHRHFEGLVLGPQVFKKLHHRAVRLPRQDASQNLRQSGRA